MRQSTITPKLRFIQLFFAVVFLLDVQATNAQLDRIFPFDEYIGLVKKEHPVMFQANLLSEMGEARKLESRGGFDPKLEGDYNHKSFNDNNYYAISSAFVKVPTWYGLEVKGGYDRTSGLYLDNSDFLPRRGLWTAGISATLGKGLFLDERRAALQKAKIYADAIQQKREILINEVIYDASMAYLLWQVANRNLEIAREGQSLAETRLEGTISSFLNGDKPAIDTLETFLALQNRLLDVQKAEQDVENTRISLNNFLWQEGSIPLEVEDEVVPEPLDLDAYQTAVNTLVLDQPSWLPYHPEVQLYSFKIRDIDVDQKLAREALKPDLRVDYNPLVGVAEDALFDQLNANNFKVGASLSYPLFIRKERGKLQQLKLKEQVAAYQQGAKLQEIKVKLDTYNNTIRQNTDQYAQLSDIVGNYNALLLAENIKFEIGESSVFLLNSREIKYLESQYKLLDAAEKIIKNRLTYMYIANRLSTIL